LAPFSWLHENHIYEIVQQLTPLHFKTMTSLQSSVQQLLRLQTSASEDEPVPEAWIFWPKSKGGLGMINVLLLLAKNTTNAPTVKVTSDGSALLREYNRICKPLDQLATPEGVYGFVMTSYFGSEKDVFPVPEVVPWLMLKQAKFTADR
jgi:hypothetical protein